ncbi:aldehyde dehydrogenase family protein [Massilia cavernae]|nr:aldehyde dehydrogenase family protein [Massilia cavernae]
MKTELTGNLIIGRYDVRGRGRLIHAVDPVGCMQLEPGYRSAGPEDAELACTLAQGAALVASQVRLAQRADFMESVAYHMKRIEVQLAARMMLETGVTAERAAAELSGLADEYRCIAAALRARFSMPTRLGLGTIVVFGSNRISMSVSVAGTFTLNALAAGCAVIAVADPGLPGISELLGRALQAGIAETGLPDGVFSMLLGGDDTGIRALLSGHSISAIASPSPNHYATQAAAARAGNSDIQVFLQEGDVNPVFILPYALNARAENIARKFAAQANDASGQLASRATVLFAVDCEGFVDMREALVDAICAATFGFLTPSAHADYMQSLTRFLVNGGVERIGEGEVACGTWAAQAVVFETDAATLLAQPRLAAGMSGPVALLVRCATAEQLLEAAKELTGQAMVSIFADPEDADLDDLLCMIAGGEGTRIAHNDFAGAVDSKWRASYAEGDGDARYRMIQRFSKALPL